MLEHINKRIIYGSMSIVNMYTIGSTMSSFFTYVANGPRVFKGLRRPRRAVIRLSCAGTTLLAAQLPGPRPGSFTTRFSRPSNAGGIRNHPEMRKAARCAASLFPTSHSTQGCQRFFNIGDCLRTLTCSLANGLSRAVEKNFRKKQKTFLTHPISDAKLAYDKKSACAVINS